MHRSLPVAALGVPAGATSSTGCDVAMVTPRRNSLRLVPVLLAILTLTLAACASRLEPSEVGVVGTTLPTLFRAADVVIAGTVEGEAGTVNTARDPRDITRAHPTLESIAQLYHVRVDEAFKGSQTAQITVALPRSSKTAGGNLETWPSFLRLEAGQRYVLFLREMPQPVGPYFAVAEPGRFKLGIQAVMQSSARHAPEYFPARDSAGLLADLRSLRTNPPR